MIICCQLSYSNIQQSNREEESTRPPNLLNIIPTKCLRVFYVCNLIKIFLGLPLWRPLKPSKFRSSTSNRISPPMSPRSGGGESEILILSAIFPSFTHISDYPRRMSQASTMTDWTKLILMATFSLDREGMSLQWSGSLCKFNLHFMAKLWRNNSLNFVSKPPQKYRATSKHFSICPVIFIFVLQSRAWL